ncbi:MAG: ribonuclease T [Gammaproteobacteria bacterium]|nr:ribonuclease T [Gammaproteobacteria bacterium]
MNDDVENLIAGRFRSYYPVVVDVETAGFDPVKDALLEVAVVFLEVNKDGMWSPMETISKHIQPFPGANLDKAALEFTGIDPDHPFRKEIAVSEKEALREIFQTVKRMMKQNGCTRAILVGHNPAFDLSFINAAAGRSGLTRNPFHPFSTFDTATLGGLAYGQTVLSRAVKAAGLDWEEEEAHSALYDAERTAELFCSIVNLWPLR